MIHLFDIENGIVIPSVHCNIIPEFKAVIDKYKDESTKVLAYLFYTTYIGSENPYSNYPKYEREEVVKKDMCYKVKEDSIIANAREKMEKMYETPTMRFYKAFTNSLDKLSSYLDNSSVSDGRDGNLDDIMKIMKEYEKLRQSFKSIRNDLKEEETANVRGDIEIAYDQMK